MKKYSRRVIGILIAFVVVLNLCITTPISAQNAEFPTEAIEVLRMLEIIPDYYDYNTDVNSYTTRADFAASVAKLLGMTTYSGDEVYYYDVPKTHWAYQEISALTESKIISGNGDKLFYPDENLEYAAAYKMILEPMGYGQYATYAGGYPAGYEKTANRTGLNEGVSGGTYVTKGDMFKILYNALICKMYDISAISDDSVEYVVSEEDTLLSVYHGIYYTEGFVTGVNAMTLDGGVLDPGEVMVNDTVYMSEYDATNFLGRHVKAFYRKNSELDKTVLWMGETGVSDVKEIVIQNSASFDPLSYKLTYFDENDRSQTMDIDRGSIVVYNGNVVTGNYPEFFSKPRCNITVIKNSNQDDVVLIKSYVNYVVDAIDAGTLTIYDTQAVKDKLVLNPDNYAYLSVKMLGMNAIGFSDISLGSILSVYRSNDHNYLEVFVSNTKETGTVSGIKAKSHGQSMTINGISYFVPDTVNDDELAVGRECTIYLDTFGDVAYIETISSDYFAAYLIEAAVDGTFKQEMKLKMLRQNGKVEVLDCADKFVVDDALYQPGSSDTVRLYDQSGFKPQLAMIKLDADGKVKYIDTIYNPGTEASTSLSVNVEEVYANYKTAGALGAKSVINNSTVLFVVPTNIATAEEEDFYIADKASFKNDTKVTYESYKTKDRVGYEQFIVIKGNPASDNTDKPVLVTGVGTMLGEDGESVPCIYGYTGNELQTFQAADETVSFNGINPGSVIRIYKNHVGAVERYGIIFDYKEAPELKYANTIDTDEINTINAVYTVTYGYVNDVVDGIVSISKDQGGAVGRVMYTNGIPVLIHDSAKPEGKKISVGTIHDARTYQGTTTDCSKIIMVGVRTLPIMFVIYN